MSYIVTCAAKWAPEAFTRLTAKAALEKALELEEQGCEDVRILTEEGASLAIQQFELVCAAAVADEGL